jgi:patatin-like phospholipase/acyl hydrolase
MPRSISEQRNVGPRSAGALRQRRVPGPWPKDREFRILSLDGGGIRGIFTATLLAELEERFLPPGRKIYECFDLIAGTSTGGIIALGLSLGIPAREMARLYTERGLDIFPAPPSSRLGLLRRKLRHFFHYRYEREGLKRVLDDVLGMHQLREAKVSLCIPSCDGRYGEVYVFKTPHHPDFTKDGNELMVKVALSTSAAPTYFQPLDSGGYRHLDGGLWANNPIMVGLTDALSSFDVDRSQIRILSISCGDSPFIVTDEQVIKGGLLSWKNVINAAVHFQSLNALGQASLLIGADKIKRVSPDCPEIELDDYAEAMEILPAEAYRCVDVFGPDIAEVFFQSLP